MMIMKLGSAKTASGFFLMLVETDISEVNIKEVRVKKDTDVFPY